jgi:hypothetical protein
MFPEVLWMFKNKIEIINMLNVSSCQNSNEIMYSMIIDIPNELDVTSY